MQLHFFDKLKLIFKDSFSSVLHVEIIIIFILLFLFLLFNLKYKRKTVSLFLISLLSYFLLSFIIVFHQEFFLAVREIAKKIVEYFYFSPVPIYFLTILIASFCLIKTMLTKGYTKRHKIISYFLLMPIFYLFTLFIIECDQAKIKMNEITSIYQNELALSCIQISQAILFVYLGSCFARFLYHYAKDKIVK